jgi:hypothetical protein
MRRVFIGTVLGAIVIALATLNARGIATSQAQRSPDTLLQDFFPSGSKTSILGVVQDGQMHVLYPEKRVRAVVRLTSIASTAAQSPESACLISVPTMVASS